MFVDDICFHLQKGDHSDTKESASLIHVHESHGDGVVDGGGGGEGEQFLSFLEKYPTLRKDANFFMSGWFILEVDAFILRWLGTLFSALFLQGRQLFVTSWLLSCKASPYWKGFYVKKKEFARGAILSFWRRPLFRREAKTFWHELPPLKVYPFTLKRHHQRNC